MPTHPSRRTVPLLILALLLAGCQLFSSSAPPGCQPLLSAAGLDLPLETLRPGRDGSVRLPQTFRAAGYLVEGEGPLVYLDPEQAAPLLEAPAGQPASLTLPGCDLAVYLLSSPAAEEAPAPSPAVLTLVLGRPGGSPVPVIRGELAGGEIVAIHTPRPGEVLAEISLLETTADGDRLRVSLEIANAGGQALRLRPEHIWLAEGKTRAAPLEVQPALPLVIAPGQAQAIEAVFTRPAGSGAVLGVLDVEYELD